MVRLALWVGTGDKSGPGEMWRGGAPRIPLEIALDDSDTADLRLPRDLPIPHLKSDIRKLLEDWKPAPEQDQRRISSTVGSFQYRVPTERSIQHPLNIKVLSST